MLITYSYCAIGIMLFVYCYVKEIQTVDVLPIYIVIVYVIQPRQ